MLSNRRKTPPKIFFYHHFEIESNKTNKIINQTCQQLFDQIIINYASPLNSAHLQLSKERVKVNSLLNGIDKLGKHILVSQLESDLTELVKSPETLEPLIAPLIRSQLL